MKKVLLTIGLIATLLLAGCGAAGQATSAEAMTKEDMTTAVSEEMAKETTAEMTKEMTDETTAAMTKEMNEETTAAMTKEMNEETTEAMTKEMNEETTEAMTHEMTTAMSNDDMKNDGQMASDFTLKNLQGDTVTLSDLKGQKVYLKFWASWCPTCLDGLPELNELSDGTQDFKIYTIVAPGMSGEKDAEAFKTWFTELGYDNIEVLLDEDGQVFKDYQIRAVPTSAFIETDGVIKTKSAGHFSNDMIIFQFNCTK